MEGSRIRGLKSLDALSYTFLNYCLNFFLSDQDPFSRTYSMLGSNGVACIPFPNNPAMDTTPCDVSDSGKGFVPEVLKSPLLVNLDF